MRLLVVAALLGSAHAGAAHAQMPRAGTGSDFSVVATRATQSPTIDGRLDDAAWASAQPISGFVQREPSEGQPVSERTEVRVLFDDGALYVGAWLYDREPSAIVLGQTLRDASLTDTDAFVMIFDTYLDRQNGFVFGTTPSGIEYDGQVTDEGGGAASGGGAAEVEAEAGAAGSADASREAPAEASTSIGTVAGRSARAPTLEAGTPSSAFPSRHSATRPGASRPGASTSRAAYDAGTRNRSGLRCLGSTACIACRSPAR